MGVSDGIQALIALGFSGVEAEVYTFLLQDSPATGYRVAQALGKPAAGVYKVLESLVDKGAVIVDEGASRRCRAVPAEELLGRLERSFIERRTHAAQALAELRAAPDDDRVYQLRTRDQVFERARSMLSRCKGVALVDAFPGPLEALLPDVEAAAGRGITLAVQSYVPVEVRGAKTVLFPRGAALVEKAPWQMVIVVIDASEHLLALFSKDGTEVRQALWSGSAPLSWILQGFMTTEFIFGATLGDPETPPAIREITRRHASYFPDMFTVLGYQSVFRSSGVPGDTDETDKTGGDE